MLIAYIVEVIIKLHLQLQFLVPTEEKLPRFFGKNAEVFITLKTHFRETTQLLGMFYVLNKKWD